ncbi:MULTISPECIES: carboxy terminal-processing peptidase [Christiangramia]|uniref:Tail-specific protease n=1 Tax=Christiangramia flava JLT2011 TaxID=1229726 RepID=A0A1L7I3P7_9FLAO|nr:carboxy terminal-processing peptidase [Christiangramia flava]APU67722.1 Tail-specific protease precursor [Christiangramia flava JLT2011]OSS40226.1 Tail-specific protease precursor [Christiangramia flava JLT2011]
MKRNFKILAVVLLMAAAACSFTTKTFSDPNKDKLLIDLITYVLNQGHYDAKDINDSFSEKVYDNYLENLDGAKRFFYKKDVEEFSAYRDKIDDQIEEKQIEFFDLTYNRLIERANEAKALYKDILAEPFDFAENEEINTDYDKLDFPANKEEMRDRWKKQLKFNTLINYYDLKQDEQTKKADSSDYVMKTDAELEKKAREATKSNLDNYFDFTDDLEREDYFSLYVNAIVEEFDPHTYYFAPQDKDRFDIAMSGKLEGIGARLMKDSDNITISEVISGGPAWRSDELGEGDVILKVKQEDQNEGVSIVGMKLDDAVDLIKGPKGTKVTLTVRKKLMGNIEDVTLTRDVIEIEETYAKSSMVEKDGRRFGVINLPKFYFDMEDYNQRNAASDIKKDIIRLKKEGMEGLVLDLRNNGGGSLKTVVDIAGMFIKDGPIVQVKSNGERKEVLEDEDPSIVWDGPLVIMVNELSASASEILAAAMQDYKRAIIIGSKQTYGKGTVQNVIDLNRWLRNNDLGDMGALKITTQKFYRVNGGSTQLEGVKSDVVVPDRYSYVDIGEKDQENPLPWDKIDAANYKIWDGYVDFDEAISNSKKRMSENEQLKLIDENAKWIKQQSEETSYSLNYNQYADNAEKEKQMAKQFDALKNYKTDLTYTSLPYEQELFTSDTILKEKRERWHESLSKDIYMQEAINVLEDMKMNNIKRGKLAESNRNPDMNN